MCMLACGFGVKEVLGAEICTPLNFMKREKDFVLFIVSVFVKVWSRWQSAALRGNGHAPDAVRTKATRGVLFTADDKQQALSLSIKIEERQNDIVRNDLHMWVCLLDNWRVISQPRGDALSLTFTRLHGQPEDTRALIKDKSPLTGGQLHPARDETRRDETRSANTFLPHANKTPASLSTPRPAKNQLQFFRS